MTDTSFEVNPAGLAKLLKDLDSFSSSFPGPTIQIRPYFWEPDLPLRFVVTITRYQRKKLIELNQHRSLESLYGSG